jgi:hypothetical protein
MLFSVKRSGSNFSGSGKYIGLNWIPNTGIKTPVPAGSNTVPFPLQAGSWYSLEHSLSRNGRIGYFLSVSVKQEQIEEMLNTFYFAVNILCSEVNMFISAVNMFIVQGICSFFQTIFGERGTLLCPFN